MTCEPGTLTAGGVNYKLPSLTPGTNSCDTYQLSDIYPEQARHNIYASAHQDINRNMALDVVGFWTRIAQNSAGLPAFGFTDTEVTGTITSANPYFHAIGSETSQTFSQSVWSVARSLGYKTGLNDNTLEQYGITPKLTYTFDNDWRAVLSFNYGRTSTNMYSGLVDTLSLAAALAGTTTTTAYNPYDPASTNPAVLKSMLDYGQVGFSHQQLAEVRLVADGALFAIPGGDVKMAAGFELHEDSVVTALGDTVNLNNPTGPLGPLPSAKGARKIQSVFGELMIPIIGDSNALRFAKHVDLSVSGRYDHYSDVGDTFNPKIGVTYSPISDLKLRGNWGKSFHAPALTDTKASVGSGANVLPFSIVYRAGDLAYALRPEIFIVGGNPGLKPEKSQSWSLGADLVPSNIPGLSFSTTWFSVNFKDQLTQPPWSNANSPASQPYITFFPTLNQVLAATAGLRSNVPDMHSLFSPAGNEPYAIIDARLANLARVNTSGLDFDTNYTTPTSFGSIHLGVSGTYYLTYNTKADMASAFINHLESGIPRIRLQASAGFTAGDLTGEVRLDYLGAHPVQNDVNQRSVASYTPVSLSLGYALPDWVFFKQSRLTLNVDNFFDEDPPWNAGAPGVSFTNLGRIVKFGLHTSL
jgi:iron complex outermembrane receptor protein